jgi:FO synthase
VTVSAEHGRYREDSPQGPAGTRPAGGAIRRALARARDGKALDPAEAAILLQARGSDLDTLLAYASRTRSVRSAIPITDCDCPQGLRRA